jgi:putative Holliday junction resolvase
MPNNPNFTNIHRIPTSGRILSLDPGTKRVGVAVCDELQKTIKRVKTIKRTSWKKLLIEISSVVDEYDAVGLIVGLPFNFDGSESEMSVEARELARKFWLSLNIPVVLQDERTTTYQARRNLWDLGKDQKTVRDLVDSEAAAIILEDFLSLSRN